jgi:hypothetical protein
VNAILDRAYGKPARTLLTPDAPPVWQQPVDTLELARRIAFIFGQAQRELDARKSAIDAGTTTASD